MASVREIRLYPVKGLDPVTVPEARVLSSGALEWDRRFAMVDTRGRFVNGKNFPGIHTVRATFDLSRGEVMIEGRSFSMEREGPEFATWFAERLEEPLEWREDTAAGFPDDTDSPGPTLVSQASLDTVAEWFAFDAEQTRRRFRANITIDGLPPFGEDRWYGSTIHIGDASANVINPCARCVVPSRNPFTGAEDPGFQKRFTELRKQHLPEWAVASFFNHHYRFTVNTKIVGRLIRQGDTVA
jgi:uncharacterized protein YcbX